MFNVLIHKYLCNYPTVYQMRILYIFAWMFFFTWLAIAGLAKGRHRYLTFYDPEIRFNSLVVHTTFSVIFQQYIFSFFFLFHSHVLIFFYNGDSYAYYNIICILLYVYIFFIYLTILETIFFFFNHQSCCIHAYNNSTLLLYNSRLDGDKTAYKMIIRKRACYCCVFNNLFSKSNLCIRFT